MKNIRLLDLIKKNGHSLVKYNECKVGRNYESVFNYSARHGGTLNSYKYYNDYVVDVTDDNKKLGAIFRMGEYNGVKYYRTKPICTSNKFAEYKTLVATSEDKNEALKIQQIFPYKENEKAAKENALDPKWFPKVILYYKEIKQEDK